MLCCSGDSDSDSDSESENESESDSDGGLRNVHDQGRFEQTIMFLHLQEGGERRKRNKKERSEVPQECC